MKPAYLVVFVNARQSGLVELLDGASLSGLRVLLPRAGSAGSVLPSELLQPSTNTSNLFLRFRFEYVWTGTTGPGLLKRCGAG